MPFKSARSSVRFLGLATALTAFSMAASSVLAAQCTDTFNSASPVVSNGFGYNLSNTRNKPSPIRSHNVASLQVALTHAAPGESERRSAPVVTEQAIIFSAGQKIIAMNRKTGCTYWTASVEPIEKFLVGANKVRSSSITYINEPGKTPMVFAGDFYGKVYGIDARTGKTLWSRFAGDETYGSITGGFQFYGGKLFIPVSSREVYQLVADVFKACCNSSGVLHAVNAYTGATVWKYDTAPTKTLNIWTGTRGPSGMPIWSVPTIDPARRHVYIGTGQNYTAPATSHSDAMIALDLDTGRVKWVFQAQKNDAWNGACRMPPSLDGKCPEPVENGKDFDFGAPAILTKDQSGRDVLLAGSKNGTVYSLNPATGDKNWERKIGAGQTLGGVHWGMAVDGTKVYASITDLYVNKLVRFTGTFNEDFDENMMVDPNGKPGLYALDITTGAVVWEKHPKRLTKVVKDDGSVVEEMVDIIFSAALAVTNDIVFASGLDGVLRAFSTADGKELWSYNTAVSFKATDGVEGHGGAMDSVGAIVAGPDVLVNSGYSTFGTANEWQAGPGSALFVFRLPGY